MTGNNCVSGPRKWRKSILAFAWSIPVSSMFLMSSTGWGQQAQVDPVPTDPGTDPVLVVDPQVVPDGSQNPPTDGTPTDGTPTDGTPTDGTVDPTVIRYNVIPGGNLDGGVVNTDTIPPPIFYATGGGPPPLSTVAGTPNQLGVANGVDSVQQVPVGVASLFQQLHALPTSSAQHSALNALSGEAYGTSQSIGLQIANQTLQSITNRLVNNSQFLIGGDSAIIAQQSTAPGTILRGQPAMLEARAWAQGYGSSGGFSSDSNASASNYNLGGLSYGVDLARDETGVFGIAGGNTFTTWGNDLTDRGHVSSFQVGLYGMKRFESFYGFAVANYGHNRNDVNRNIKIGTVNAVTTGSFTGHQFGSYGEAGVNLDAPAFRLQPFAGLQYVYLSNGRFTESGGGGAALNVAAANLNTLQSHLGARLVVPEMVTRRGLKWTPYVGGRWVYDMLGQQNSTFASLSGAPGASWVVTGAQSGRNVGMVGPGVTVELMRGVSLFGNYDFQWANRYQAHTGSGGVLIQY